MSTTGIRPASARRVNAWEVITPEGVWALVVIGERVVAPFVDVDDVEECARDLGLRSGQYVALPFLGRGQIATL